MTSIAAGAALVMVDSGPTQAATYTTTSNCEVPWINYSCRD
ncbi:hypothetical protein [Streptomyces halobius]|nr:hypothetical protein [Streptomyces halobius]